MELKKLKETRERVFKVICVDDNRVYDGLTEKEAYDLALEHAQQGHEVRVEKEIRTHVSYAFE